MREIRLNNKQYKISGDITKRAISPWIAKISSGSTEFKDFSTANLEEWHDFRNGIGIESATPAESNRTWFTEGIDFSTPRSAVLGPLVTTAGSAGSAPIKILDFQGNTYVICADGSIKVWDTTQVKWLDASLVIEDCEDEWDGFQHGNATHAVDASDYKVGSNAVKITVTSATTNQMLSYETISSIDLSKYDQMRVWIKSSLATTAGQLQFLLGSGGGWQVPTSFTEGDWADEALAYDGSVTSDASISVVVGYTAYLELTHAGVYGRKIRIHVHDNPGNVTGYDIDVWCNNAWHVVISDVDLADSAYVEKDLPDACVMQKITKVRIRAKGDTASGAVDVNEFNFENYDVATCDVPVLAAGTWTNIVADLSSMTSMTDVTLVGINSVADLGTEPYDIWFDDVRVVDQVVIDGTPLDAIVITDSNDEWFIVTDASHAEYWAGGDTDEWNNLISWHEGHSVVDEDSAWSTTANLIDDDTTTSTFIVNIGNNIWTPYIEVVEDAFQRIDRIRYFIHSSTGANVDQIDIDIYHDGAWEDVYEGAFTKNEWVVKEFTDNLAHDVTKIRISAHADSAAADDIYISGLQFGAGPSEYMATYANRLYWTGVNGSSLNNSATGDITTEAGHFTISGDLGTIYGLFEGKLLADGTPVLYFHGTKGIYSLDITNEIAYRQEVNYPPLTYAGHAGMYWNGSLWVATGFGITKITPSLATEVGPNQDDGLPETYHGSIFDMLPVNNWLVYCVNKTSSSDKSSILKRNSSYGGSLQVYTSAENQAIACLHHSPSSLYAPGRLWFGEGTDVKYMMFPDTTSNVKQVSTYEYVDGSGGSPYSRLPIFRKLAAISKVALGVAAITKSCDSDEYIQVFYGLNGVAPTTSLGYFKDSPRAEILTFNSGLGIEFYTIQFSLKLFRGSTDTNSPELESLLFYYIATPETISGWTFNIEATSENAEALITTLEAIRDTATLVVFNPTGDPGKRDFNYNVKLTTMPMRFYVENMQTRKGWITIDCQEIFNG